MRKTKPKPGRKTGPPSKPKAPSHRSPMPIACSPRGVGGGRARLPRAPPPRSAQRRRRCAGGSDWPPRSRRPPPQAPAAARVACGPLNGLLRRLRRSIWNGDATSGLASQRNSDRARRYSSATAARGAAAARRCRRPSHSNPGRLGPREQTAGVRRSCARQQRVTIVFIATAKRGGSANASGSADPIEADRPAEPAERAPVGLRFAEQRRHAEPIGRELFVDSPRHLSPSPDRR